MLAGLDPRSLLDLDGPLFDAIERVVVELAGGDVEHADGDGNGAPVVGALAFASEYGPRGRR